MTPSYKISFTAVLILLACSCSRDQKLSVEPVSEEYNNHFLTGEGLDSRYFSTKDVVQYYQVSGLNSLSPTKALHRLKGFVDERYRPRMSDSVKNIDVLFYRKKWLTDYSQVVYESARDNENRTLEDYSDELVAWINYERLKGKDKKLVRILAYFYGRGDAKTIELRDTIRGID